MDRFGGRKSAARDSDIIYPILVPEYYHLKKFSMEGADGFYFPGSSVEKRLGFRQVIRIINPPKQGMGGEGDCAVKDALQAPYSF